MQPPNNFWYLQTSSRLFAAHYRCDNFLIARYPPSFSADCFPRDLEGRLNDRILAQSILEGCLLVWKIKKCFQDIVYTTYQYILVNRRIFCILNNLDNSNFDIWYLLHKAFVKMLLYSHTIIRFRRIIASCSDFLDNILIQHNTITHLCKT